MSILYRATVFLFLFHYIINEGYGQQAYTQSSSGVEISLRNFDAGIKKIKLAPITDQIIHVTGTATDTFSTSKSLILSDEKKQIPTFKVEQQGDEIKLSTKSVVAEVSTLTGLITFKNAQGTTLLSSSTINYESMKPMLYNGEPSYQLTQIFKSQDNEAYYGLGQHQQDIVNYNGRRVDLSQYNTEIAVPMMVSNKNYGILWDNASITRAGDIRDYSKLNALKLYSKDGQVGWLTASYSTIEAPDKIIKAKAVSDISINYLTDQHLFDDSLKMQNSIVNYEGALESGSSGIHQIQLKYAGYIKVWVDGKLVADWWRQAWNPRTGIIDLPMSKGKRVKLKMEWRPNGGESYLGLTVLTPLPEHLKNTFAFQSESGAQLNYYFIQGDNADQVIGGYRQVTGKATLMPKWAMGFWQSRERYKTQEEILSTVKEFRTRRIPLDNIVLDWLYWKESDWGTHEFDLARFPDATAMIKQLHEQNAHLMISVWAKFNKSTSIYNDFNAKGYLYKRNIMDGRRDWVGKGYENTSYDAFNPIARRDFWDLMNKRLYSKGIDAWWMDATEPDIHSNLPVEIRKDLTSPNYLGSSTTYFNAFPLVNAKGVYEGQRKANPNDRVFILTRSAFAGLQRYAAAAWSGDIASRWEDMKTQIGAGINFSLSGLPYWTMDIGGFSVEKRYETQEAAHLEEWRELNMRWYQFGAFVPLFRVHGQFPLREMYNIAPASHPAYQSMLYYNKLRYRLMPYIYSLAGNAYHENSTIMRGLVMDFPSDEKVLSINDAYMFGPSFLINPVYTFKATSRQVYLPSGHGWYDLYSGKYFNGGQSISAAAPMERMPVFVKQGAIIPMGPELQYTSEKPTDTLTVLVYTGKDGRFLLYEDEGINYNYEQKAYSTIELTYKESSQLFTIGKRQGTFTGMLNKRIFNIIKVTPNAPLELDYNRKGMKLEFTGETISAKL